MLFHKSPVQSAVLSASLLAGQTLSMMKLGPKAEARRELLCSCLSAGVTFVSCRSAPC